MKAWQRRALNFEVKAIESILGIKFEGTTLKEKQVFVAEHKQERIEATSQLLGQEFEHYTKDKEHYA